MTRPPVAKPLPEMQNAVGHSVDNGHGKQNVFYTAIYGQLAGLNLELVCIKSRPHNLHGDLWLMENGSGRKYWLRAYNVIKARND